MKDIHEKINMRLAYRTYASTERIEGLSLVLSRSAGPDMAWEMTRALRDPIDASVLFVRTIKLDMQERS